jgi:hypothetical protein
VVSDSLCAPESRSEESATSSLARVDEVLSEVDSPEASCVAGELEGLEGLEGFEGLDGLEGLDGDDEGVLGVEGGMGELDGLDGLDGGVVGGGGV